MQALWLIPFFMGLSGREVPRRWARAVFCAFTRAQPSQPTFPAPTGELLKVIRMLLKYA